MRRITALALAVGLAGCGASVSAAQVEGRRPQPCAGQAPGCGTPAGAARALAKGRWRPIAAAPLGSRYQVASAWTGTQLVVWGGATGNSTERPLSTGAAYSPTTRHWSALPRSPLKPRFAAASVWDGHAVLVWGGQTAHGYAGDGATYTPATRTWRLLPNAPIPGAAGATMLWTGRQGVVFGGGRSAGYAQTTAGAAYDPANRTWTRLPAFPTVKGGVPLSTTAVWTGQVVLAFVAFEIEHRSPTEVTYQSAYVVASWTPGSRTWQQLPAPKRNGVLNGSVGTWDGRALLLTHGSECFPDASCPGIEQDAIAAYRPGHADVGQVVAQAAIGPTAWTGRSLVDLTGAGTLPKVPSLAYQPDPGVTADLPTLPAKVQPELAVWTGREILAVDLGGRSYALVANLRNT